MKNKILLSIMVMIMLLTAVSCKAGEPLPTPPESSAPPVASSSGISTTPSETPEEPASPSPKASPSQETSTTPSPSVSQTPKESGPSEEEKEAAFIAKTKKLKSGAVVNVSGIDKKTLDACFYYESISDKVFKRMYGKSFKKDCTTKRSDLRYIKVLYYGFDKKTHVGELVANKALAKDFLAIFRELYHAKYRIEKMRLSDDYNADDDASMADNNTSCFNFRRVEGSKSLSQHAYGRAIDINPFYNPYFVTIDGKRKVEPPGSEKYADRTQKLAYIIKKGDVCYKAFVKRGFSWGGGWKPDPDYQHFSKKAG